MDQHKFIKELALELAEKMDFPFDPCDIYLIEKALDESFQKGVESAKGE